MVNPETRLSAFQAENNIFTKGPLSLVIQFTRLVRDQTFPLNPDDFQTSGKGQVAGLGGGNLKKILINVPWRLCASSHLGEPPQCFSMALDLCRLYQGHTVYITHSV